MYREVKEKLLRTLTLLEDQKAVLNKNKLVDVLQADVHNKSLAMNEQGEQILLLRQKIAKMRNTIKDLREERVIMKKTAQQEKLKAEAAMKTAVTAAVSKAEWRIKSSPLKRTYTTPSSMMKTSRSSRRYSQGHKIKDLAF